MHVSVFYFLLIAFSILVYMLFSYSAFRLQECSIKSVSQSVKPITFWMSVKQERDDKWQRHQLDHTQTTWTSIKADNHASTTSLSFTGWMLFPMPSQQHQRTEAIRVGFVGCYTFTNFRSMGNFYDYCTMPCRCCYC